MKAYNMYINGKWVGNELDQIEVINPATNEVVGTVPNGGEKEAELAIDAAYDAFQSWSQLTAYERSK